MYLVPAKTDLVGQARRAVEGLALDVDKPKLLDLLERCLRCDSSLSGDEQRPSALEAWKVMTDLVKANGGDPRDLGSSAHRAIVGR